MQTKSVMLQTLCVPCGCRCRYCLLSWDGRPVGADYDRSQRYAARFHAWMRENRGDLSFNFSFGYSMEHPRLLQAIDFLRSIGSVGAEYLQCDGMRLRSDAELDALVSGLAEHGVKHLNFTFYGDAAYHDAFAGRKGDYAHLLRMAGSAAVHGLETSAGVPLTRESAPMADALADALERAGVGRVFLFVPHEEGRGAALSPIRLSRRDFDSLSPRLRGLLNPSIFKTEAEWLASGFQPEESRTLIVSLTPENISRFEAMPFPEVISHVEALDDAYYAAFPPAEALAELYGDPAGDLFYRQRDLLRRYRKRFAADHALSPYDVTDERQCGSRRS